MIIFEKSTFFDMYFKDLTITLSNIKHFQYFWVCFESIWQG